MPDTQKDIYARTTLGTYYKVEGKNRVFRWEHDISYHLVMNGEYKDTLLRHETNYMKHSLFEDGLSSISSSYKVEHTEALDDLNRVFHLFFRAHRRLDISSATTYLARMMCRTQ